MPKISALPLAVTPTGDDLVAVVQAGVTKKAALAWLPIQSAVTDALALKAPLASPAFTGTPTGPTAVPANNTTQFATTAFVQQELLAGSSTARALVVSVRNQSGGTMTAGTVVYINGSTGNLPTIAKANATSDATSAQTLGLVQTSIANNDTGLVVVRGILGNLSTSGLTEGQQLYLSPTWAGTYTTTKQYAPNHLVYIGIVTRAHSTQGSIEVAVQNGFEMDELHDVSAQSPTNGDTLRWNAATSLWEKSALGTLATQNGTFSGTSSGTNTGDQTALTVANTPAGGIAATTVQAALNELDTEKANLASPTFTGNPLAPTPATTDNDTSIATTAMVQAVANAQWTHPTPLAITAAGNSNVAAATAQNRYLTQRINVTAFTGTATVTLQSASAIAGDKRRFIVSMPAGFANLIELRNLTSGGTLLATVPMDGALARTWVGYSTFDGTNWGAVSFSPMSVDEFFLSRTISRGDYIQSDGATANRAAGIYGPYDAVNNPREYVAGAASLTDAMVIPVPTASSTAEIVGRSSSNTALASETAWSMGIAWSGNDLVIRCNGATPETDFRTLTFTGLRTTYSGQTIFAKAAYTNGTTAPVFSINGGTISGGTASNGGGTTPDWLSASLVPTYRVNGYNWPAGPAPIVRPILGQTSAADDAFYMQRGKPPAWVVAGGSMRASITNSFDSESSGWVAVNSGTITNNVGFVQFYSPANDIRVERSAAIPLGTKVLISFEARAPSTATSMAVATYFNTGTSVTLTGSWDGYTVELGSGTNSIPSSLILRVNGDGLVQMRNLSIKPLGALSLPSVQPINVLDDVSGIGGNQGRTLGMTAVTDKTKWRISANTWTNGNQQILAGPILDSNKDVIDLVEQSTTGTPTTTIGSASAGSQYKASGALTAGINPVTLVTRKLASNDVWVSSSSTAVVRTTIVGHRTN
jgi:hypothetical protein